LTNYVLCSLIDLRLTLRAFGSVLVGVPLSLLLSFGTLWRTVHAMIAALENACPRYPFLNLLNQLVKQKIERYMEERCQVRQKAKRNLKQT
jgi:hypothetical protein